MNQNPLDKAVDRIKDIVDQEVARPDDRILEATEEERRMSAYSAAMDQVRDAHKGVATAQEGVIDAKWRAAGERAREAHTIEQAFTKDDTKE